MKWMEVAVCTTNEAADVVSDICISLGAAGTAIEDGETLRDTVREGVVVKAYYPEDISISIIDILREKLGFVSQSLNIGEARIVTSEIDEQDWANNWKKYYKPFKITQGIVVKPTWEPYSPEYGERILELDPGMAFGTGTHETTKLCAGLISECVAKDDKCADIGTGSGILTMIMSVCGAGRVEAVDTDPVAVRVARENIALNSLQDLINVQKGSIESLPKINYNVIAANIIADVIISMADKIPLYIAKEGIFIASGIIRERCEEVKQCYTQKGFAVEKVLEIGEWAGIKFRWQGSL